MTRKIVWCCLLLCCITSSLFAQDAPMQVVIQNQYEGAVKEAKVTVVRTGQEFTTDVKGNVALNASPADQIKVNHPGYDSTAVALSGVTKENVLKVKKSFSWVDLVTPMFYIINGGLWLIIFIIFAETGLFAGFFLPGDSLLFCCRYLQPRIDWQCFPLY